MNPTVSEKISLSHLLQMESAGAQSVQAMLPVIGDSELRQFSEGCLATATAHTRALAEFAKKSGVAH